MTEKIIQQDILNILLIYAGKKPDKSDLAELLKEVNCEIVFATPDQISPENIDPKDFDQIISILNDDLACDDSWDSAALSIVNTNTPIIGVWAPNIASNQIHPAMMKIGIKQLPWDPKKLEKFIGEVCPQPAETPQGTPSNPIYIKPNICG